MAISNRDIGSAKYGTGSGISYADIGSAQAETAAPAVGGQVIIISKLLFPVFWLKQGKNNRRDFLKTTFLSMIGIR